MALRQKLAALILILAGIAVFIHTSNFRTSSLVQLEFGLARSYVAQNVWRAIGSETDLNTTLAKGSQDMTELELQTAKTRESRIFPDFGFTISTGSSGPVQNDSAVNQAGAIHTVTKNNDQTAEAGRQPEICSDRRPGVIDAAAYSLRHSPTLRAFASPLSSGRGYTDGGTAQSKQDGQATSPECIISKTVARMCGLRFKWLPFTLAITC